MCDPDAPRSFLVCYDGSAESLHALQHACDLSKPQDKLSIMHVSSTALPQEKQDELKAAAEKELESAGQSFGGGKEYYFEVNDHPGQWLSTQCRLLSIDYCIIGCRGLSGLKKTVLGSVSESVVHHAPCPVLIVRGTCNPATV
mmetsp:Transcript_42939/g.108406  ORF Transcript_42939/g.108406 Transcript_42939/m.108406 type:complete len:143 (+) Transcript_42939:142-570(+)|eukprot:CAMPEP_0177639916 /NCGR_PEP_ID=MMETSP0447-20121125/6271_1 /TAXON_ID=0 /ORGANISM="Stygamoeba regulata, Strain BSH-02190019" /LENGTH=142 /DNA_ID=CAMNT_0019141965 /DNA_START=117 /DNA_END=545 /DNA_ORIENTATION=+